MSNCPNPSPHTTDLADLRGRIATARRALLQARREALAAGTAYQVLDVEPLYLDAAELPEVELPPWTEPRSGPAVICLLDALDRAVRRAAVPVVATADQDISVLPITALAAPSPRMAAPEAAAFCGVSEATWWRQHSAGKVPAPVKIGRRTLWDRDELRAWLAAGCPDRKTWQARSAHRRNGAPV
jgi:predicted DNA-binding transcriptional regulator AlpA